MARQRLWARVVEEREVGFITPDSRIHQHPTPRDIHVGCPWVATWYCTHLASRPTPNAENFPTLVLSAL